MDQDWTGSSGGGLLHADINPRVFLLNVYVVPWRHYFGLQNLVPILNVKQKHIETFLQMRCPSDNLINFGI